MRVEDKLAVGCVVDGLPLEDKSVKVEDQLVVGCVVDVGEDFLMAYYRSATSKILLLSPASLQLLQELLFFSHILEQ